MSKTKELAVVDEQALAEIDAMFPKEKGGFTRIQLPRISYVAQDIMEGEGKKKVCVTEAGTFFLEVQTDKLDANNKKIWDKVEIGKDMEGIIMYYRYQLSYYDEKTEKYTSSPVYDEENEIIPLWCDKNQVAKGTPEELKKMYEYVDPKDNKSKSNLKENRILYILYKDELHQLSLHGSSMFSFMTYKRTVNPAKYLTHFNSEAKEKGATKWNMMTFKADRPLDGEEVSKVVKTIKDIQMAIAMEKGNTTPIKVEKDEDDVEFIKLATGKN